jgi:hypothetical protein
LGVRGRLQRTIAVSRILRLDEDKRPWIGRRVWIFDSDGKRRHGTLWWSDGASVQIRIDTPGLTLVPVAARGERWDFIGGANRKRYAKSSSLWPS